MLLSFIIPAYNCAPYIGRCLDSIFAQKIDPDKYEVIVIDDGSNDDTPDILTSYSQKHPNLFYKKQENSGPGVARNNGLKYAKGEYIQFIDSDDYILPYDFECLITETCNRSKIDILAFNMHQATEDGNFIAIENPNGYNSNIENTVFCGDEFILKNNFIPSPCSYMFNRKFLCDNCIEYRITKGCEDIDHTVISLLTAQRVQYVPNTFYVCVNRSKSLSRTPNIAFERSLIDAILITFRLLSEYKEYNENPALQQKLSDWLIHILRIQNNHLYQLPLPSIFKILRSSRKDMRSINKMQRCSKKHNKAKSLLKLRAYSSLLSLMYIALQKFYNKTRHAFSPAAEGLSNDTNV